MFSYIQVFSDMIMKCSVYIFYLLANKWIYKIIARYQMENKEIGDNYGKELKN